MQGRITARHLPLAEKTFPGISAMYGELAVKPVTFLQLVWLYEARRLPAVKPAPTRRRVSRASRVARKRLAAG